MRVDDFNRFPKWEDELPSPEELIPLSQTLISPDLALVFNISGLHGSYAPPLQLPQANSSAELDSPELSGAGGGGSAGAGSEEPARTLKRPRLVWTPQLHKRFVDAVAHLGIKNAVPKTIMQLMSVDGLTRENVASHLQKYRLYLKRVQNISRGGGGGANGIPAVSGMDPATDRLFASSPVPAHFLHPGRVGSEHVLPFVPLAAMPHHHHHHHHHPQQFRDFGGSPQPKQRMLTYAEDSESISGKKVLTLFPTGNN